MSSIVLQSALVERDGRALYRDQPFTGIGASAAANGLYALIDYVDGRPSGTSVALPVELDLATATIESEFDYQDGDTVVLFQDQRFTGTELVFDGDLAVAAVGHQQGVPSGNALNWSATGQLIGLSQSRHWPEIGAVSEGYRWHEDGTLAATSVGFDAFTEASLSFDSSGQVVAATCLGDYFGRIKKFAPHALHRVWQDVAEFDVLRPAAAGLTHLKFGGLERSTETALVEWLITHKVGAIRSLDLPRTFDRDSLHRLSAQCVVDRVRVSDASQRALDTLLEAKRINSSTNVVYNDYPVVSLDDVADDFTDAPPRGYVFDQSYAHLVGIRVARASVDDATLADYVNNPSLRYVWLTAVDDPSLFEQASRLKRRRPDVDVRVDGQPVSRLSARLGSGGG